MTTENQIEEIVRRYSDLLVRRGYQLGDETVQEAERTLEKETASGEKQSVNYFIDDQLTSDYLAALAKSAERVLRNLTPGGE